MHSRRPAQSAGDGIRQALDKGLMQAKRRNPHIGRATRRLGQHGVVVIQLDQGLYMLGHKGDRGDDRAEPVIRGVEGPSHFIGPTRL